MVELTQKDRGGGREQAILRAAEQVFAERSYEGASIRIIAATADVNPALVGYYFGTKAELYREIFARRYHDITEERLRCLDAVPAAAAQTVADEPIVGELVVAELVIEEPVVEEPVVVEEPLSSEDVVSGDVTDDIGSTGSADSIPNDSGTPSSDLDSGSTESGSGCTTGGINPVSAALLLLLLVTLMALPRSRSSFKLRS